MNDRPRFMSGTTAEPPHRETEIGFPPYPSESAVRLHVLLTTHAQRANRYLLINAVSAAILGCFVAVGLSAAIGIGSVWRSSLMYLLAAIILGVTVRIVRRRRWTAASAAAAIDRALDCDNLTRAAWVGMYRETPGAFLEFNLRSACRSAERFQHPPPWALAQWYALRDWVHAHRKALRTAFFYFLLLLLLALWLYMLLNRKPAGSTGGSKSSTVSPTAADDSASKGSDDSARAGKASNAPADSRAGKRGDRSSSGGAQKASGHASGAGNPREGQAGADGAKSGAASGGAPTGSGAKDSGDPIHRGEASGDRPGRNSVTHGAGGSAPDATGEKRLIVMPGMDAGGGEEALSKPGGRLRHVKPSGPQQEAVEVRPPGRIPREYERFLK